MTSGIKGSITHGRRAAYVHGCRCEPCRAAHTAQLRLDRAARYDATKSGQMPAYIPHGRPTTYSNWGCRCRSCTDAWRVKLKADKQRAQDRGKPYPSTAPAYRREKDRIRRAKRSGI